MQNNSKTLGLEKYKPVVSQGSWCSAPLCRNSRKKCPSKSFFAFPKESTRCQQWVLNVGRADLLQKTPETLYRTYCLCADHFEEDQFMNKQTKSRLVWNAEPTLFKKEIVNPTAPLKPKEEHPNVGMNPVVILKDCMSPQSKPKTVPMTTRKHKILPARKSPSPVPAKRTKSESRGPQYQVVDICAFPTCKHSRTKNYKVAFFPFPRDSERCRQWLRNINRQELLNKSSEVLNKTMALCAAHFDDDQFINSFVRRRLVWDAVPQVINPAKSPSRSRGRPPKAAAAAATTAASPYKSASAVSVKQISSVDPPLAIELIKIPEGMNRSKVMTSMESPQPSDKPLLPKVVSVRSLAVPFNKPSVPQVHNVQIFPKESLAARQPPAKEHLYDVSVELFLKSLQTYFDEPSISLWDIAIRKVRLQKPWSERAKKVALIAYAHFPLAYAHIHRVFKLPSVRLLRKWLSRTSAFVPGIRTDHLAIFHDAEFSKGFKDGRKFFEEKVCMLTVQQLTLRPQLSYSARRGTVLGLEDLGTAGRSKYVAVHALVFTVKGLLNDWSFPLGFYPVSEHFALATYEMLLLESLHRVESLGLLTKLVVLSDHLRHHGLLEHLNVTVSKPFIQFRSRRLIVMLSPIGLLRRFRHKLRQCDLMVGSECASWQHISGFRELDASARFPLVPGLTEEHVGAAAFAPIPTRWVVDVFQQKVAAGLSVYSSQGKLPPSATTTADVVHLMWQLLDCFSGLRRKGPPDHPLRCAISEHSPHLQFLSNFLVQIRNWRFADSAGGTTEPALRGWHLTVAALVQLWFDTQKFSKQTFLRTRYFRTQDAESWKVFRPYGDGRKRATCRDVGKHLEDLALRSLLGPPKRLKKRPKGKALYFVHLVKTLQEELHFADPRARKRPSEASAAEKAARKPVFPLVNMVSYVAGYIVRIHFKDHACDTCAARWVHVCNADKSAVELFTLWLGKATEVVLDSSVNIIVPTTRFINVIRRCERLFARCFPRVLHMDRVRQRLARHLRRNLKKSLRHMCRPMRTALVENFLELRFDHALKNQLAKRKAKKVLCDTAAAAAAGIEIDA